MFADMHLLDATRLTSPGHPFPYYLFLTIPFLYLFALAPTACVFRPLNDPLTPNKTLATTGNPRRDPKFLLGTLAGAFVLLQSNVAGMIYVSLGLLYSALAHRPL
jgi:hypothetical protein